MQVQATFSDRTKNIIGVAVLLVVFALFGMAQFAQAASTSFSYEGEDIIGKDSVSHT